MDLSGGQPVHGYFRPGDGRVRLLRVYSNFYAYTATSYPSSVLELTPTTSYLAYGAGPLSHGSNNEVYSDATSFVPAPAPEPSSAMLLVAGLLMIGFRVR